MQTVIPNS